MKNIKIISVVVGAAALAAAMSCSRDDRQETPPAPQPLVFSVMPLTRAANYPIEEYFNIDNSMYVGNFQVNATYIYNDGLLLPADDNNIITFPADGEPLEFIMINWPVNYFYYQDQSTKEAFLQSDLLHCAFENLMPATVIPVEFIHYNYVMTFTCGSGDKITALTLGDGTTTYTAYCDPDLDDAQLIVQLDTNLSGMIGKMTLDGGNIVVFTLGDYDIPYVANMNFTVTITL